MTADSLPLTDVEEFGDDEYGLFLRTMLYGDRDRTPATIAVTPPDRDYPELAASPDTQAAQALAWATRLDRRFREAGLDPPRYLVCRASPVPSDVLERGMADALTRWRQAYPGARLMLAADVYCLRSAITVAVHSRDRAVAAGLPPPVTAVVTSARISDRARVPGEEVPLIRFGPHGPDLRGAWRRASAPEPPRFELRSPYPFFGAVSQAQLRRVAIGLEGPPSMPEPNPAPNPAASAAPPRQVAPKAVPRRPATPPRRLRPPK